MQWFKGIPTQPGWYFYSEKPQDWERAKPVPVRRIDEPGERPKFAAIIKDSNCWTDVEQLKNGIWLGPVEFPEPHPAQAR